MKGEFHATEKLRDHRKTVLDLKEKEVAKFKANMGSF